MKGITTMPIYRIEAKSYLPHEEITYVRATKHCGLARQMAQILCCAFEEVTVSDITTGDLYLNHYIGLGFESMTLTHAEALTEMERFEFDKESLEA